MTLKDLLASHGSGSSECGVAIPHEAKCAKEKSYSLLLLMRTVHTRLIDLRQHPQCIFAWGVVWLVLSLPCAGNAGNNGEYDYEVIGSTINITAYTGGGGDVIIPRTINGMTVTSLGDYAFSTITWVTSATLPDNVTSVGKGAFSECTGLMSVTLPNSVTSIGVQAFHGCTGLTSTTGWGPTFGGRPTVLWNPQVQPTDASFGVRADKFGFTITGTGNLVIVEEACTNLANPAWSPVGTNTLTDGASYFSDPLWTKYPARFYRLRSP